MVRFIQRHGTECAVPLGACRGRHPHGFCCPKCDKRPWLMGAAGRMCATRHQTTLTSRTVFDGIRLALTIRLASYAVEKHLWPWAIAWRQPDKFVGAQASLGVLRYRPEGQAQDHVGYDRDVKRCGNSMVSYRLDTTPTLVTNATGAGTG